MFNFIKNLKIRNKLLIMIGVFIIGISFFAIISWSVVNTVKVNGKIYNDIVMGKDLIADILPPPAYLIEQRTVLLQMLSEKDKNRLEELSKKAKELAVLFESRYDYWKKNLPDGRLKDKLMEAYAPAREFIDTRDRELIPALLSGDREKAMNLAMGIQRERFEKHHKAITETVKLSEEFLSEKEKTAREITRRDMNLMIILAIATIIVIVVIGFIISNVIVNPIKNIVAVLKDSIGQGDLTKRFNLSQKDEVGDLGHWFDTFAAKTHDIIVQISKVSSNIASVSEELSASSVQIAKGAESQTQKASQVATASTEMSATIVEIARSTSDAANAARNASKSANGGGELVRKTVDGMDSIARSVKGSAGVISGLGERSNEIGKIIKVIDDIADQTNLLALNAAIEAARAGEQGRGFAVVADEVRKLAERTTKATKEIGDMIEGIQEDTKMAVTAMETGTKEVEKGVILAKEAGEALKEIVGNVDKVTEMVQQIATASDEQSTASDQISADIETVAGVTKEAESGAEQIADAAHNLSSLASELQTMVARFKVGEEKHELGAMGWEIEMQGGASLKGAGSSLKSLPGA